MLENNYWAFTVDAFITYDNNLKSLEWFHENCVWLDPFISFIEFEIPFVNICLVNLIALLLPRSHLFNLHSRKNYSLYIQNQLPVQFCCMVMVFR